MCPPVPPAAPVTDSARASRRRGNSPWRCLSVPSMRWWSAANLVSNTGAWMQLTVQNLLVLQITGSAAATGLSLAVQAGPGLLLGVFGGAVVDRWPLKVTAAVSQAVLAVIAFSTAALIGAGMLNVPVLLVLAAVTGIVNTIDGPATSLLGNDLVPRTDVPSAIALGSMVHSAGRLAGTALAAVAVRTLGTGSAYVVNGISFLCVTAVIPFLRPAGDPAPVARPSLTKRTPAPRAGKRAAGGGDARAGVAYFLGKPGLVALAGITAVSSIFGRNYQLTLAVLVIGPLGADESDFGTVSTVLAVGGILGAVVAGRLRNPTVRLVGVLAAVGGLLQVAAGLAPGLMVLIALVVPMAVVESVSDTAGSTVLQTEPEPEMRGRVLGVWRSASTGWQLAGPPLLGLLVEFAGARGALVAGGLLIAGAIAAGGLRGRATARKASGVPEPLPREPVPAAVPLPALTPVA
ncbi:MFS transporter [Streptomyces sp. SID9124]|uniref:MFS transporter n=1 Tax=Streptomyces sp. SID9124 TaxID=2706108 RepID=UPI0013DEA8AD|nr:MFS transporter [Streptomyces sp. SID9124]NED12530.1 MFS transporter [Streptomyces sp. SID9124]